MAVDTPQDLSSEQQKLVRALVKALDAIAVVGAIILVGEHKSNLAVILGTIAIVAATSNVVGGFIITDRMLRMFKSSGPKRP